MAYTTTELPGSANRSIGSRSYVRRWRIVSDAVIQHPAQVISQAPVVEGALFQYDTLAACKSINADYEDAAASREVVIVSATYETGSGGNEQVENEDPLQDRPSIRWGSRTVRVPVRLDIDGKPILNSAGQKFDPPAEEDLQVLVYEYSHNIATYSEANAQNYRGAINSDNFTLAGLALEPYQARITSINATNAERNGTRYWRESVVVEIADDWRLTLVDEGIVKKSAEDGAGDPVYINDGNEIRTVPILDANGVPVVEQVLLDGQGEPLGGGDPVLLKFDTVAKPPRAFGPLGLPITNNP